MIEYAPIPKHASAKCKKCRSYLFRTREKIHSGSMLTHYNLDGYQEALTETSTAECARCETPWFKAGCFVVIWELGNSVHV